MTRGPRFAAPCGARSVAPPASLRGRARAIYADPNWSFEAWSERGLGRAPDRHYRTMSVEEIAALPVGELADPTGCLLFLWAYTPMTPQAFEVMRAWGFRFVSKGFTWGKRSKRNTGWHFSTGYWTRQQAEICWIGSMGNPVRRSAGVPELIVAPVREHSRKPDETRERIEALTEGPYLELFARTAAPGWYAWGDELDKF